MAEATGSSPVSSTVSPRPAGSVVHGVGAHEFRNHFGSYLERAAGGEEVHVTRRGKAYARLMPTWLLAGRRESVERAHRTAPAEVIAAELR
jgi:prevent-host-death family protein